MIFEYMNLLFFTQIFKWYNKYFFIRFYYNLRINDRNRKLFKFQIRIDKYQGIVHMIGI